MNCWRWAGGALLLVLAVLPGSARADRVISSKTVGQPAHGARPDGRVPYLTNGYTTLGVYQGVAPAVYASPLLGPTGATMVNPVYNLPFYGARQAFGGLNNGAVQRPPDNLRGR